MPLIANWYFTACLNMRPKDAADLLAIFDGLEARRPDTRIARTAIAELERCDIWARVYAIPKLLLLGRADRVGQVRECVERSLEGMLNACGDKAFKDDVRLLLQQALRSSRDQDSDQQTTALEQTAQHLLRKNRLTEEASPYLSLPSLIAETLFLSVVANVLLDSGLLAAVLQRQKDGDSSSLQALLERALSGSFGRLAALQAAPVLHTLGTHGTGRDLALRLLDLPDCCGLAECDIACICALLETQVSGEASKREAAVKLEITKHCAFDYLCKARPTTLESVQQAVRRLGIRENHLVKFTRTAWDMALVNTADDEVLAGLVETVSELWARDGKRAVQLSSCEAGYVGAEEAANIWCLAAGAVLGLRIASATISQDKRFRLLQLATHAEIVYIKYHDKWLMYVGNPEKREPVDPTLSTEVTSMALFSRITVHDTAMNESMFKPDTWFDAAMNEPLLKPETWFDATDDAPWMLLVLTRWVEGLLMGAPNSIAVKCWQTALPELLRLAGNMKGWPDREQMVARMLGKFCCQPAYRAPRLDSWEKKQQRFKLTKLAWLAREIIAQPLAHGSDWLRLGHLATDKQVPANVRVAACVERFLSTPDDETRDCRVQWANDLTTELACLFKPEELDRWVRHRLLSVIIHPQSGDAGRLAVQLIVQLGSPSDIHRLVSTLLADTQPAIPDLEWKLLHIAEGLAARADGERLAQAVRTSPTRPAAAMRAQDEIDCWLSQCATLLAFCPVAAEAMRERFAAIRRRQMGLHRPGVLQVEAMEAYRNGPVLTLRDKVRYLFPWMLEQVVEDPAHGSFSVLYSYYWCHEGQPVTVVVSKSDEVATVLDFKTGKCMAENRLFTERNKLARAGALLLARSSGRLENIKHMPSVGMKYPANGVRLQDGDAEFSVEVDVQWPTAMAHEAWLLWDADESLALTSREGKRWDDLIVERENKTWKPALLGVHDLIAHAGGGEVPFCATITLVRVEARTGKSKSWIVSCGPGSLFLLQDDDFCPEARAQLQEWERKTDGRLEGLKVRVTAQRDLSTGRMILEFSRADVDDVNLRWRDLFADGEAVSAMWDAQINDYIVQVPSAPAPFPGVLKVTWEGKVPRHGEALVTGIVTGWDDADRRAGKVRLARAETIKLGRPDGDLLKLHAWVVGLAKGSRVTLTGTIKEVDRQGNVLARIKEGLIVQVAAESLSLLAEPHRTRILTGSQRQAILTSARWPDAPHIRLEIEATVADRIGSGHHIGVVIETPIRNAEHRACAVLFISNNGPSIVPARLLSDQGPRLGSKVLLTNDNNRVVVSVSEIVLFGEALYEVVEADHVPLRSQFVGLHVDARGRSQAWVDPNQGHKLLLLAGQGKAPALYSTRVQARGTRMLLSPSSQAVCQNTASPKGKDFRGNMLNVQLEIMPDALGEGQDSEHLANPASLAGWCPGLAPVNRYEIEHIELWSYPEGDTLHRLRRLFIGRRLEEYEGEEIEDDEHDSEVAPEQIRDEVLRSIHGTGKPVDVIAYPDTSSGGWNVVIKELQERGFPTKGALLPVPTKELHHCHHGRDDRYDRNKALAMVLEENSHWLASFRSVPPKSLSDFQMSCGGVALDTVFHPQALIFIGQDVDRAAGTCRFEFGFGLTFEIADEHVRIDNQPLSSLQTVLCHGDRIKALKLTKKADGLLLMEVMGLDIAYGDAHRVFLQAANHQFVHTLSLGLGDQGEPRVIAIKGFNEAADQAQQEFSIPYASLPPDETSGLKNRILSADKQRLDLYARLNIERFKETAGRACEFQPVNFDFAGRKGLKKGDKLLVEAGEMRRTGLGNDIRLNLHPLTGVEQADGLAEVGELGVLRREFSARESLLGRFLGPGVNHSTALQGMVFAVAILHPYEDGGGAPASLLQMPPRKPEALLGTLRVSGGSIFATVANLQIGPEVAARVEARPGVFFDLRKNKLEGSLPPGCAEGTLVRVELSGPDTATTEAKVRLVICQFSPWRYLSETTRRPSFALPLDALLKVEALTRDVKPEMFTAQDFPTVKFSISRDLTLTEMNSFMGCPHPKLVWIGKMKWEDGSRHAVITPETNFGSIRVGCLAWNDGADVWFLELAGKEIHVEWHQLSFSDLPIKDLKLRCEERGWFVHDRMTGCWTDRGIRTTELSKLSVATGPLFADDSSKSLRLRYRTASLQRFGIPLANITDVFGLQGLDSRGVVIDVTVAATSKTDGRYDGVWVEWVPGRIIELPTEMLVWRSGPELLSLSSFDWSHVASGDELELRLVAGEALAADRIEIISWRRGPRGACVPEGDSVALLPSHQLADDGSLRLGAGAFQLTLPYRPRGESSNAWCLGSENRLFPFKNTKLRPRDVVLLKVDISQGEAKLTVAGAPGYEVRAAFQGKAGATWNDHPLGNRLIWRNDRTKRHSFLLPSMIELVKAAGGALPVTVEWVGENQPVIDFSFARQIPSIKAGRVSQAVVLGGTPDNQFGCLWLGRGVVYFPMGKLVQGLPPSLWADAVSLLAEQRIPVWLRAANIGAPHPFDTGLCDDNLGDIAIEAVAVCSRETASPGLVVRSCRSQLLYFISQEYLSWTDLSADEIKRCFLDLPRSRKHTALRARLRFNAAGFAQLSLIDTPEARREGDELRLGHALRVTVEADIKTACGERSRAWLVRSLDTGLFLRCDVSAEPWPKVGDPACVEISARRYKRTLRVVCAPKGLRTLPVALPRLLLEQLLEILEGKQNRSLRWQNVLQECKTRNTTILTAGPDTDLPLEDKLIWAWELSAQRTTFAPYASEVALSWIKQQVSADNPCYLHQSLLAGAILCNLMVAGPNGLVSDRLQRDEAETCFNHWWDSIRVLLSDLHGRCLRSLHLAVLTSHLHSIAQESDFRTAAACRQVLELLAAPLLQREHAQVLRLAGQLLMDHGRDRHELAGAFLACLGRMPPPQAMPSITKAEECPESSRLLTELSRVCSPFVVWPSNQMRANSNDPQVAGVMAACLNGFIFHCSRWPYSLVMQPSPAPILVER